MVVAYDADNDDDDNDGRFCCDDDDAGMDDFLSQGRRKPVGPN